MSDAERAIIRLNEAGPVLASLEALARILLRAESIASSRIEGLEVAPRRLARAEVARSLGQPAGDQTAEAVLGNIQAMSLALSEITARDRLVVEDILAIHRALMLYTNRPELGGIARTTQNWIGGNDFNPCGAAFVPPPPEHVPALLEDLVGFMNADDHSPLIQAALAHAQFETIHPFADGNGRTGRALIHVVLRRRGLAPRYVPPISLVLATRSRDYVDGLTTFCYVGPSTSLEAERGIAHWIGVFAAATTRAVSAAEFFGRQVDGIVQSWRERAAPLRKNSAADLLIRALPAAPVVTVATAAALIGRSKPATNAAIEHLAGAGVLIPTRDVRRNRAFEAAGLLDALTGFERGLASPTGKTREPPPVRRVPYRPRPSPSR